MTEKYVPVPISGIPLPEQPIPHHPVPLRQNINTWYDNPDNALQVSLFIQALIKFQELPFDDQLSYFRIASIHYLPCQPWNTDREPSKYGYCHHNQTTFSTWHRPYLVLYERRLYDIMKTKIIQEMVDTPEKKAWEFAAENWRLPYWDWADDTDVPKLICMPSVKIVTSPGPSAERISVSNPLYQFTMPTKKPMGDKEAHGKYAIDNADQFPFALCKATSRYGITWNDEARLWVDGVQKHDLVNAATAGHKWKPDPDHDPDNQTTIREAVRRILSDDYFKSWKTFASTKFRNDKKTAATEYFSLETIHNSLHNWIGGFDSTSRDSGAGHMSSVPVAAFDPIFYIHHCNIDRLLAIWQATNWSKWFDDPQPDDNPPDSELVPFRPDPDRFFTSDEVRYWGKFNYTYPEVENFHPPPTKSTDSQENGADQARKVRKAVNELYGKHTWEGVPVDKDGEANDYLINVIYKRTAFGGVPYVIHFFIGDVSGSPGTYSKHQNHVGSVHTFSTTYQKDGSAGCENCKDQDDAGVLSKAQVPIKLAVQHRAARSHHKLRSTAPDDVEGYLADKLTWRVVLLGGLEIPSASVPDLLVSVVAGKVRRPSSNDTYPHFHSYRPLHGATEGKDAGATSAHQLYHE